MAPPTEPGSGARPDDEPSAPSLLGDGAVLLGLSGLAVAQPLLDLLGRNPTYFVATGLSPGRILALALLVTFVPPAVLLALEAVATLADRRAGRLVHLGAVAVLGALLGAGLARHVASSSDVATVALAVVVGGAVTWGRARVPAVALGLRYLAAAPVLVLGAFVFASEATPLLFGGQAGAADVEVADPAPVLLLQLDELPLASLLRPDGTLNEARFPGFARLAARSTWYRNATSVSSGTNRSVPSIVTGTLPESELPTSADYPDNLFTLLGGSYDLDVHETVTQLCPTSLCPPSDTRQGPLGDAVADSLLVLAHVVLPPSLRSSLPAVDRSWGDFFDRDALAGGGGGAEAEADPQVQGAQLDAWIAGLAPPGVPTVSYAHVLLPHSPWLLTRSGKPLTEPGPLPGSDEDGRWSTDPVQVREGLRRHLLQVEYVDTRIDAVMDRLDELGTWDETLVVVVADHGVAFTPGQPGRFPADGTEAEIFSVPLFVKYPGQADGRVDDRNALTIDVLPTVVDALDVGTDWTFDGQSLLDEGERRVDKPVAGNETHLPVYVDQVFPVAERNLSWLPGLDDERGLAPVAPYADLVGRAEDELDVRGESPIGWQTFEPVEDYTERSPTIPLVQVGTLLDVAGDVPASGLFVVNGRVAGVLDDVECDGDRCGFRGLLDERTLRPAGNRMDVLLPEVDGGRTFVRARYVPMRRG
ncbi:MAG: sulfatase-like hydrolase/transferase [Acidimicrobiales bacterium]|nr:sulfatase-like hydrolase/transferase [Acidimicrobiales bacterium]